MYLADAFIQSDLQCIQAIIIFCQYVYKIMGVVGFMFPPMSKANLRPWDNDITVYTNRQ